MANESDPRIVDPHAPRPSSEEIAQGREEGTSGTVEPSGQDAEGYARLEGAEPEYDQDGNLLYVRMPPHNTKENPHPQHVPGYEPLFDRQGPQRRLLGFISEDTDLTALGPRNTIPAIAFALSEDRNSPQFSQPSITGLRFRNSDVDLGNTATAEDQVEEVMDDLVQAGLVEQRNDGSYAVTAEGLVELLN